MGQIHDENGRSEEVHLLYLGEILMFQLMVFSPCLRKVSSKITEKKLLESNLGQIITFWCFVSAASPKEPSLTERGGIRGSLRVCFSNTIDSGAAVGTGDSREDLIFTGLDKTCLRMLSAYSFCLRTFSIYI